MRGFYEWEYIEKSEGAQHFGYLRIGFCIYADLRNLIAITLSIPTSTPGNERPRTSSIFDCRIEPEIPVS
jgi:hypothetical protein